MIRARGAASINMGRTPHEVKDEMCRAGSGAAGWTGTRVVGAGSDAAGWTGMRIVGADSGAGGIGGFDIGVCDWGSGSGSVRAAQSSSS